MQAVSGRMETIPQCSYQDITFSNRTDKQEVLQIGHQVSSFQFNTMIFVLPKMYVSQNVPAEEPNYCNALLSEITRWHKETLKICLREKKLSSSLQHRSWIFFIFRVFVVAFVGLVGWIFFVGLLLFLLWFWEGFCWLVGWFWFSRLWGFFDHLLQRKSLRKSQKNTMSVLTSVKWRNTDLGENVK